MKRYFFILMVFILILSSGILFAAPNKTPKRSPIAVIEFPHRIVWLKDKPLFGDPRYRYLVAAKSKITAEKVLAGAVAADQKIRGYFNNKEIGTKPVLVLVMEDEKEFEKHSNRKNFQGLSMSFPYNGKETQIIVITKSKEGICDILPHELTHLAVFDLSKQNRSKKDYTYPIPLCLNEGIAEFFTTQTQKRGLKKIYHYQVTNKESIPLERLFSTRKYAGDMKGLAFFYSESFSLVDYILTLPGGKEKLIKYIYLFDHRKEDPYELFKEVFCKNISSDSFKKGWTAYVYQSYRTGKKPPARKSSVALVRPKAQKSPKKKT